MVKVLERISIIINPFSKNALVMNKLFEYMHINDNALGKHLSC